MSAIAQAMRADQVTSAPAPTQASVIAPRPSATSPSIGAARRLISAKSRTIAAEWLGIVSGPVAARQTRPKCASSGRRPGPATGSRRPLAALCALNSLITARYAPPHALFDYAVQIINDPLTTRGLRKGIFRGIRGKRALAVGPDRHACSMAHGLAPRAGQRVSSGACTFVSGEAFSKGWRQKLSPFRRGRLSGPGQAIESQVQGKESPAPGNENQAQEKENIESNFFQYVYGGARRVLNLNFYGSR